MLNLKVVLYIYRVHTPLYFFRPPHYHPHTRYAMSQPSRSIMVQGAAKRFLDLEAQVVDEDEDEQDDKDEMCMSSS